MTELNTRGSEFQESLRAVTRPIADATGLPNCAYTDPELFAFDRDEVLGRTWAAIGFASEVPAPGCVKPVDFMGIPLLIVRDKQGEVRVFHNVCSHRGLHLVGEAAQLRTVIRCPYHSWSYEFDGRLVSTPHIGGVDTHTCDGFDKDLHGLRPVRFAVWMDIVFVNLSGTAGEFTDYVAPLEDRWAEFIGAQDRQDIVPAANGSRLTLEVACNWKLAVENFCEAYHLPWVHPDLNSYSPLDQHYGITDGDGISGQGTYRYDLASVAGTRLPKIEGWPQDKLSRAEYIALYPNTLLGLQADHVYAVIIQPLSADRSTEKMQIGYRFSRRRIRGGATAGGQEIAGIQRRRVHSPAGSTDPPLPLLGCAALCAGRRTGRLNNGGMTAGAALVAQFRARRSRCPGIVASRVSGDASR
jgi:choline monooxygenase